MVINDVILWHCSNCLELRWLYRRCGLHIITTSPCQARVAQRTRTSVVWYGSRHNHEKVFTAPSRGKVPNDWEYHSLATVAHAWFYWLRVTASTADTRNLGSKKYTGAPWLPNTAYLCKDHTKSYDSPFFFTVTVCCTWNKPQQLYSQ